jgi:hypothetical protein
MVFLVDVPERGHTVLKFYTENEQVEFKAELEANLQLASDHTRVIKMCDFVGFDTPKEKVWLSGVCFE